MKIDKTCGGGGPKLMMFGDIPTNTVFRYNQHGLGPYLKLAPRPDGTIAMINLATADYVPLVSTNSATNYLPLPNAHLVTEEAL